MIRFAKHLILLTYYLYKSNQLLMTLQRFISLSLKSLGIYLLISFLLGSLISPLFLPHTIPSLLFRLGGEEEKVCDYNIQRIEEHTLVKPMLSVEPACESKNYFYIKKALTKQIEQLKEQGNIQDASIYLWSFKNGEWMSVNDQTKYHPASLLKVPLLMAYLRMAEMQPEMLKHQLTLQPSDLPKVGPQHYIYNQIEPGKPYSIHELLYYMVAFSDNRATWLLSSRQNFDQIKQLFANFGLTPPDQENVYYTITTREYSSFFKALYNSSYLSPAFSQYAAELLSNCAFKDGFAKAFPEDTKMWHKFGEWKLSEEYFELHESGIVTIKNEPYLLTIMTKGDKREPLVTTLQQLAKTVHDLSIGP